MSERNQEGAPVNPGPSFIESPIGDFLRRAYENGRLQNRNYEVIDEEYTFDAKAFEERWGQFLDVTDYAYATQPISAQKLGHYQWISQELWDDAYPRTFGVPYPPPSCWGRLRDWWKALRVKAGRKVGEWIAGEDSYGWGSWDD